MLITKNAQEIREKQVTSLMSHQVHQAMLRWTSQLPQVVSLQHQLRSLISACNILHMHSAGNQCMLVEFLLVCGTASGSSRLETPSSGSSSKAHSSSQVAVKSSQSLREGALAGGRPDLSSLMGKFHFSFCTIPSYQSLSSFSELIIGKAHLLVVHLTLLFGGILIVLRPSKLALQGATNESQMR